MLHDSDTTHALENSDAKERRSAIDEIRSKQGQYLIAGTLVVSIFSVSWHSGPFAYNVGILSSPFVGGFILAGLLWILEKGVNAITKNQQNRIVGNYVNSALKASLILAIVRLFQ